MSLGFVVFFRLKELSPEQAQEARKKWLDYKKNKWPKTVKLIGEYDHAYGSDFNGFVVIETPDFETFASFYPQLRENTRWYVSATTTVTGVKRED
jgi:hypothetical protein